MQSASHSLVVNGWVGLSPGECYSWKISDSIEPNSLIWSGASLDPRLSYFGETSLYWGGENIKVCIPRGKALNDQWMPSNQWGTGVLKCQKNSQSLYFKKITNIKLINYIAIGLGTPKKHGPRYSELTRYFTDHQYLVLSIQIFLKMAGYDVGKPDGIYGPVTRKALGDFLQDRKIANKSSFDKNNLSMIQSKMFDYFWSRRFNGQSNAATATQKKRIDSEVNSNSAVSSLNFSSKSTDVKLPENKPPSTAQVLLNFAQGLQSTAQEYQQQKKVIESYKSQAQGSTRYDGSQRINSDFSNEDYHSNIRQRNNSQYQSRATLVHIGRSYNDHQKGSQSQGTDSQRNIMASSCLTTHFDGKRLSIINRCNKKLWYEYCYDHNTLLYSCAAGGAAGDTIRPNETQILPEYEGGTVYWAACVYPHLLRDFEKTHGRRSHCD